MIRGIQQWLLGVVLVSFAGGLALQLTPKGREQGLVRLVCGLLLTLAILRPLARMEWTDLELDFGMDSQAQAAESYRKDWQDAFAAVIEEKTEAYILDKADRLGLQCTVRVAAAAGENGIPLPDTVTIEGSYSGALAACIEEEVGIPPEKQIWLEENAWESKKSP